MSWPTLISSMVAAACLTMALPHVIIGITQRGRRVHLFFVLAALAVAWMAAAELSIMRAVTTQESGRALQGGQIPTFIVLVAIVGFVQLYFGSGRLWLGVLACGILALCLVGNFADPPNMNFREVTALRSYQFLGDTVTMPLGPRNPWLFLGYVSSLLVLAFVIDASRQLWRTGTSEARRRAVGVGGAIVGFVLLAQGMAVLINAGAINFPYSISIPFLAIVGAMGFELSFDFVRAAQLSRAVREGEERMSLAAESARLSMWEWDITPDEVWMTQEGRALLGFAPDARIRFASLVERLHPEDREARETAIRGAVEAGGSYEMEYRLLMPDGSVKWIAARGRCAAGDDRNCRRLLGASIDITERKQADAETRQLRDELAHVTRVATLSELSGSLAHELNQPLGIILSNAQAAQRLLAQDPPDIAEVRDVLTDIVAEDRRAGEVIQRLRALLKRGETALLPLSLDEVVAEVLHLTNADLIGRGVAVVRGLTGELPRVQGDRIQLQQVVLNLILNGADAMSENAAGARRLHVCVAKNDGVVRVSVRDEGCGLPADMERIFEAFFTTKPRGLGMGLAICRSIVAAHEGRLWAERHPQCGAVFHLELQALPGNGA